MKLVALFAAITLLTAVPEAAVAQEAPARDLFGAVVLPSRAANPTPIGSYAKGCIAGAVAMPELGPEWQTMRPGRNRNWGHPNLIAMLERLAKEARGDGWPGLLIGDMGQPRGGPMRTGHASHQIGLDADIWLTPRPARVLTVEERESLGAGSMLVEGTRSLDPIRLTPERIALIRRASLQPEVSRIFVHPAIKQRLCEVAGSDRGWLRKVRPWWGHDAHFHVRIACPAGDGLCQDQDPPPPGDGCGTDLAWWLTDEPWKPSTTPPAPPLKLADLPEQCRALLTQP